MSIFNFFKKNKTSGVGTIETEKPSPEQVAFADEVLVVIGATAERFGFKRNFVEIKSYCTKIVFRKDSLYINILSTSYPTDYPNYYDIIFSEGKSKKCGFYWNSVTVLRLAKIIDPSIKPFTYNFPYNDLIKVSLETANRDLLKYGASFLSGDLSIFFQARQKLEAELATFEFGDTNLETVKFDKSGVYQIISP